MDPTTADPQNPACSGVDKADHVAMDMCYAENRAVIHLHGGITPWISDGTPHQWITPAGEDTAYPEGVSVENVPDMDTRDARTACADVLLHQRPERAVDVLPRPRLGHHPAQRVCR